MSLMAARPRVRIAATMPSPLATWDIGQEKVAALFRRGWLCVPSTDRGVSPDRTPPLVGPRPRRRGPPG